MKNDASKKQTSLLDALDQPFSLPESPTGSTQLDTPTTLLRGQKTIDHYFEAGSSSSSKDSNEKQQLRKAREIHDAQQRTAAGEWFYIIGVPIQDQELNLLPQL